MQAGFKLPFKEIVPRDDVSTETIGGSPRIGFTLVKYGSASKRYRTEQRTVNAKLLRADFNFLPNPRSNVYR
jgi:hypothetical protein